MSFQYDKYLIEHRFNVKRGFDWLAENLPELLTDGSDYNWQLEFAHDKSKNEPDEYEAYDAYFYGGNRSYAVVQNYKKAWLLHLHRNPHHWQHWILINDDPEEGEIILEMPYIYIIEMICDWWSFSWHKGKLDEIFSWYDEHSKYMKLHPTTRKTVENILSKMKSKLDAITIKTNESMLEHHGIKGQKWGVKNGPPYPIDKSGKSDIVRKTVTGHTGPSKRGTPNGIVDHITDEGTVKARAFYDSDGWKKSEIHTTNHGNPKHHSYGTHGEHIHYYEWDKETGKRKNSKTKEIPIKLRKENDDIL